MTRASARTSARDDDFPPKIKKEAELFFAFLTPKSADARTRLHTVSRFHKRTIDILPLCSFGGEIHVLRKRKHTHTPPHNRVEALQTH
jgi:hypothetical protein